MNMDAVNRTSGNQIVMSDFLEEEMTIVWFGLVGGRERKERLEFH
jgi:hypothetical protein